jgi:hypothetical protein
VSPEAVIKDMKIKAIWECLTPRNKHKLWIFLSLRTYYKWFTSGFADIAEANDQTHREETQL